MARQDLAFVSKEVRDATLQYMDYASVACATTCRSPCDRGDAMREEDVITTARNRCLYRDVAETDAVWFPFDMPVELVKELIWESGDARVKWVLHGTPAAGSCVLACVEMGCSVVSLCENDHHRDSYQKALVQPVAESYLRGTCPTFGSDELMRRASRLSLSKRLGDKAATIAPSQTKTKGCERCGGQQRHGRRGRC